MSEQNTLSISELQQQANAGDALAQLGLACYYNWYLIFDLSKKEEFSALRKIISPKNINEELAFEWLKKAAEQSCADAQYLLAKCYLSGQGVGHNNVLAIEWLKKAAEQGNAEAQCYLADLHIRGLYLELNDAFAFECLEKAAERGVAEAQYRLALCYYEGKGAEQNDELALEWLKKAAEQGVAEAPYRLALCYFEGKGTEQNVEFAYEWFEKSARQGNAEASYWLGYMSAHGFDPYLRNEEDLDSQAFEYYLTAVDRFEQSQEESEIKYRAFKALADCFESGRVTWRYQQEGNNPADLKQKAEQLYQKIGEEKLAQLVEEEILTVLPNSRKALELLGQRIAIHISNEEFDLAEQFVNQAQSFRSYVYKDYNEISIKNIAQDNIKKAKKIREQNLKLQERNQKLQQAQQELEDMMSMFAHKFRSPLDAIIYNTTHENQVKLYTEAAQTMRGLLDIFSLISTDAALLKRKLMADNYGNGRLATTFSKALDMVLLHLLTNSNREKVRQHYIAHAKLNGKVDSNISRKVWREDYFELEQSLQTDWEQDFATLILQSASLTDKLDWVSKYFFSIQLIGFDREDIEFEEYGITESLLMIVINEIVVNVFKYYSCETKQPVIIEWGEKNDSQVISCRNPSYGSERTIFKGSQKGHVFLSTLARNIDSHFVKPIQQDEFMVEFAILNELLISSK